MITTYLTSRFSVLFIRINFKLSKIKRYSLGAMFAIVMRRVFIFIAAILFFPASVLLFILNFRRPIFFTDRIGHLAIEPDTLLKSEELGILKKRRWVVVAPKHRVANEHLLNYWRPFFSIYQNPLACILLEPLFYWPWMRFDASYFINKISGKQVA